MKNKNKYKKTTEINTITVFFELMITDQKLTVSEKNQNIM